MKILLKEWIEQGNKKLEQEEDMEIKVYSVEHRKTGYVGYETESLEDAIETKKRWGRAYIVVDEFGNEIKVK